MTAQELAREIANARRDHQIRLIKCYAAYSDVVGKSGATSDERGAATTRLTNGFNDSNEAYHKVINELIDPLLGY